MQHELAITLTYVKKRAFGSFRFTLYESTLHSVWVTNVLAILAYKISFCQVYNESGLSRHACLKQLNLIAHIHLHSRSRNSDALTSEHHTDDFDWYAMTGQEGPPVT